jgi:hypothetical protein
LHLFCPAVIREQTKGTYGRIFALAISFALLHPLPAYSDGDEFVPPSAYGQQATEQKINGIKEVLFGDPIAVYGLLTYFTVTRIAALKDLFTQVPDAMTAARVLWNRRRERDNYLAHEARLKALQEVQPELFSALQSAAIDHSEKLTNVESKIAVLSAPGFSQNRHWREDLTRALLSWKQDRDITRLDEWIERYKDDAGFKEALGEAVQSHRHEQLNGTPRAEDGGPKERLGLGEAWLKDFNEARRYEEMASSTVTLKANAITEKMNEELPLKEKIPMAIHTDAQGRHTPGVFFQRGANPTTSDGLVAAMKERCELGFGYLTAKSGELARTGSKYAAVGAIARIGIPVFTLGSATVLTGLTVRAYLMSYERYGKDPTSAQREVRHRNQVNNEVTVAGEASFSGQVAAHEKALEPLLKPMAEAIHAKRAEILEQAKAIHARFPEVEIDWAEKEQILDDPEAIALELSAHLAQAKNRVAEDFTFSQWMLFMNRAPNNSKYVGKTKAFVNELYSRSLDGIFSELEMKVDSENGLTSISVGTVGTQTLRPGMVAETVAKIKGLTLPVPEHTPHHPAIPPPPKPTKAATTGGLASPGQTERVEPESKVENEKRAEDTQGPLGEPARLEIDATAPPSEIRPLGEQASE